MTFGRLPLFVLVAPADALQGFEPVLLRHPVPPMALEALLAVTNDLLLGCNGLVKLLLEPLSPRNDYQPLAFLAEAVAGLKESNPYARSLLL